MFTDYPKAATENAKRAIRTSDANKMMKFKSNPQEIKDLDSKEGVVVAYANVYDFEDSDGDISAKGSFKRTVNNNFKRIRVLKDHNSTISLGIPLEMNADDPYGLKTTTQFNLKKEVARDMFTDLELMLENGMSPELSIGYEVIKRDDEDRKIIKEYKLYEYSFLTGWGANMLSIAEGVKDLKSTYGILELIEKSYNLDYSDSRLRQIEELLKSITEEPVLDTDSADATPDDSLKHLFDNFNLTTISWNLKNK